MSIRTTLRHINRTTTYSDPRESIAPEGRRTVKIQRRPEIGFGFVAAGQHPTIIQFVSAEGPSDGLLYANDQILAVNGKDVRQESKDNVVAMVRSANDELELTVEQLPARPVALIKAELPRSIYGSRTGCFDAGWGARSSRISLLRPETKIVTIIRMPNSDHLRCVFRFAFIPKDIEALWLEDPRALDYYYQQCTADVVRGRYAFEMRYEACVRLAALHMQQVTIESNLLKENNTVSLTRLESEYGLNSFLPLILLENVKRREIRKHVRYYLKKDSAKLSESLAKQGTRCDGQQSLLSLRVTDASVSLRVRYLDLLSHLPSFGGRGFSVTFKESQIDMIMQIDPRIGLLVRHPGKTGRPTISIDYDLIDRLVVRRDSEISSLISIRLKSSPDQGLEFLVDKDDIDDLVGYICGYQLIHCNRQLACDFDETPPSQIQPPTDPPPYSAVHKVIPCGWNYSSDITSSDQSLDLTSEPPPYELANSFAESLDEKRTASHSPRSARQMESVSDSSDAEDSSWSSPVRSPFIDGAIRKMMNGPSDGLVYEPGRRESIETLISSVHAQQVPNLETLILFYQDSNGVKSKMPPIKENGASAAISQGDDRNVVAAPMASIEEEMTISQITAAS
ncbi:PDZ/DHR/GLGF domain protein [Teladorsagia circumcincta]|uniref:PDZ/DHR/GLGF domain protein n=1 Tax=Teladorsagia circumcincta TaxID=45464 RepID=A0A2G9UHC9_TELCI|nr:PDZ/DHR/GLGF domain protein [Teladorsagia circumcincta]